MRATATIASALLLIAAQFAAVMPAYAALGGGSLDEGVPGTPPPSTSPSIPSIGGAPPGAAGPDRALLVAAIAANTAAQSFDALTKDSATTGIVPRQGDPGATSLLDTVFDVDVLKGKDNLTRIDIPSLLAWLSAVDTVSSIYVYAGTGVTDASNVPSDPAIATRTDKNSALYAPEIGRALDAILTLSAAVSGPVGGAATDISSTVAGASALDQMREDIAGVYTQTIGIFPLDGIDAPWRQARLNALTASAPAVAKFLLPAQCTAIRAVADKAGHDVSDASATAGLMAFDTALKC